MRFTFSKSLAEPIGKKRNCARIAFLFLLFLALGCVAASAQVTGSISGIVRDSSGAVLPGASVVVKQLDTGQSRTVVANESGRYQAQNLAIGKYEVTGSLSGFQTVVRSGIELTVGRQAIVDLELPVGQVAERVTVTGEAPLVDTTSASLSSLVDDQKMRDLPLNGRGFTDLAFLQPGVFFHREAGAGQSNNGFARKASINGTRPEQSRFLMDGGDIQDISQKTPGGVSGVQLGVDAVKEFEVRTNSFSAEFGHSSGGVVNAVTKSGTNQLHGSLFEFLRNDKFDARNFFDRGKAPLRRNQFGGSIGGPIKKDRAFFFFNYEGLRWRLGTTTRGVVPDANARRGILPGIAPFTVNAAVVPYLEIYPLPNGRSFSDGTGEYIRTNSNPTTENYWVARGDWTLSDKDSLSVRYNSDKSEQTTAPEIARYDPWATTHGQFANLSESRIFSPTIVNSFRFSFNRSLPFDGFKTNGDLPEALHWVPGKLFGDLSVTGISHYGTSTGPASYLTNLFEYADTVTVVRGRHTIKFGGQAKRLRFNPDVTNRPGGQYTFQSLVEFLQNRPFRFHYQSLDSIPDRRWRQSLFGFFGQDEFRMNSRLTLNYGMRYEFITVPTEIMGRVNNLRNVLDPALTVGDPFFKNPSLKNFAPRLGIAWDPFGNGKTSVRSGFGLFFDQIWTNSYRTPSTNGGPPYFSQLQIERDRNVQFPYGANNLPPSADIPQALQVVPYQFSNPYTLQYNLTIQRQLPSSIVVSVGYVGTHGVKLGRVVEANTAYPTYLPDGRQFFPPTAVRRNLNFTIIRERAYDALGFYNSFQLNAAKRFSNGLQFQGSYTFSRNVTDADGILGSVDNSNARDYALMPEDHRSSRGLSSLDIRHNFVFNYTYEFPFARHLTGALGRSLGGWSMSGVLALSTGMPFNLGAGYNVSNNRSDSSTQADRPDLVSGRSNNPVLGGSDQYYDPTAFVLPLDGFYGNLGRNTVIGPGFSNFDFSLGKETKITEKTGLQFRAEFFNLLNRANFAHPATTLFNSRRARIGSAGRINQTVVANRQIQLSLRLTF